jgi:hypothetical protein
VPSVRRLIEVGLVQHEAGGIIRTLIDVEHKPAVLKRARIAGVAIGQLGERRVWSGLAWNSTMVT